MGESHWHHFVPAMYLKGFLDPKKVAGRQNVLWVYQQNKKVRPKGPKRIAGEHGFNYTPETPGSEDWAESALAVLENAASRHLAKLRAGSVPLTAQEKSELSTYIGVQKFRTRLFRETMNSGYVQAFRRDCAKALRENRVPEIVANLEAERGEPSPLTLEQAQAFVQGMADGCVGLSQTNKTWTIEAALDGGKKVAGMVERMHWTLLEAPGDEPWITSDNPVVLLEPFPIRGPKHPLFGPSLQVLFPVSPRFLVFGEPMTKGPDDRGRVPPRTVRQMNGEVLSIAHLQVYASFYSKALQDQVNQVFKERPPIIPEYPGR